MTDEQRFCACENDWTGGTGICQECKLPRVAPAAPPVAEPAPQTFEEWWASDKQWKVARSLEGQDDCDECCRAYALAAWNAAKASSSVAHEWLGCEEANGWFVASCSCGWTYRHPNYGTTQDTFVNHWGDHIKTLQPLESPAVAGGESAEEVWNRASESFRDMLIYLFNQWGMEDALHRILTIKNWPYRSLIKDVRGKE